MSIYGTVGSLVEMRGYVLDVKPNITADKADRIINQAIRSVAQHKTWSDLLKFVAIPIPNATTTGKVSTQTGSSVITGDGTNAWPFNDLINTTIPNPIRQPGMQFVQPAAMANPATNTRIIPGMWLLIDAGVPGAQEAVAVIEVSPAGFWAIFQNVHSANATIWLSSLSNLQFRTTFPFYTITGVTNASPQQLLLDMPWSDITQSGASYTIFLGYCQPNPYISRLQFAWDPVQGVPIDVDNWTFDQIVAGDPQMTASDNPTMMAPAPPSGGGTAQWLIYPPQVSQRYITAKCSTVWPRLIADQDRCPAFMSPDVFILKAQSIALRTKTITIQQPKDPWYDPAQANEFERLAMVDLSLAEEADEARLSHRLQSYAPTAFGAFSSKFLQSHPGWPTDYNV